MDTLIEEVNKLDNELYRARYIEENYAKREELWNSIKCSKKLLEAASKVVKNKYRDKNTFLSTAIVECILIDYNMYQNIDPNQLSFFDDFVDQTLYQELVNKIYLDTQLARIVLDGYANGGYSFLLYTLFNDNLDLTNEQKAFALEEAMNKMGTMKYKKQMDVYEQKLDKMGITDGKTVIAPEIGPIGAKIFSTYMAGMFYSMNTNQAHGRGEFDIRYHILKNHNFADKMEQLVYDFYAYDEEFDEIVDYWEWNIVNLCRKEDDEEPRIYVDELLFISDEEVLARLPLEQATEVIKEIHFIKRLHEIRPLKKELGDVPLLKVLVKN